MNISKKFSTKAKNVGTFFLFAGPSLFFFVMAILVPLVYGVYLTFTDWNGISKEKNIVGIENYLTAFTDGKFWSSLLLTMVFTAISVALVNYIAFHLARLVTSGVRLGTPAVTTRGLTVEDMDILAECIALAINDFDNSVEKIRGMVNDICARHPLYA